MGNGRYVEQALRCSGEASCCSAIGSFGYLCQGSIGFASCILHGDVTVLEERVVHDGNIWTAAGVSAGIDLMLAFIGHTADEETAGKVQFAAEYYPSVRRYGPSHQSPMAPGYLKKTA